MFYFQTSSILTYHLVVSAPCPSTWRYWPICQSPTYKATCPHSHWIRGRTPAHGTGSKQRALAKKTPQSNCSWSRGLSLTAWSKRGPCQRSRFLTRVCWRPRLLWDTLISLLTWGIYSFRITSWLLFLWAPYQLELTVFLFGIRVDLLFLVRVFLGQHSHSRACIWWSQSKAPL